MSLLSMDIQPNFPHEDLTDNNALLIELVLQNKSMFETFHQTAEASSALFRLSHRAIHASVRRAIEDINALPAYSMGMGTYEAISLLVQAPETFARYDESEIIRYFYLDPNTEYQGYERVVDTAREQFITNLPRTSTVITAATARFYPGREDQVLTGAALTYVAECDITQR